MDRDTSAKKHVLVSKAALTEFAEQLLATLNVPPAARSVVADNLVTADLRGVHSHGVLRLPMYCRRLERKTWDPNARLTIAADNGSTLLTSGNNGLGHVIAEDAMNLAIERADDHGIALVSVRNSGHFGAAAYYSMKALDYEKIGIVASNASPAMAPWGGKDKIIGNNPWSVAVPAARERPIVIDMANTVVARGKIMLAATSGHPIPQNWAVNRDGYPTTDPQEALDGLVLPMAEHKGYAISLMVDILAGVLSNSAFGPQVVGPYQPEGYQGVGHLFIAIDLKRFGSTDNFKKRVDSYIRLVRESRKAPAIDRIYLPGEIEAITQERRLQEGIPLTASTVRELSELGNLYNVDISWSHGERGF